jgi:hypothetical protein
LLSRVTWFLGSEQDHDVVRTGLKDMIQSDDMADDVERSFERRLNPFQMYQLISISSCAM